MKEIDEVFAGNLKLENLDLKIGEEIEVTYIKELMGADGAPDMRGRYIIIDIYPRGYLMRKKYDGMYNVFFSNISLICQDTVKWKF